MRCNIEGGEKIQEKIEQSPRKKCKAANPALVLLPTSLSSLSVVFPPDINSKYIHSL